jgi:hypothetical protein
MTTGHVSVCQFKSVCEWFQPQVNDQIVNAITSKYDGRFPGSLNYFRLLSDICEEDPRSSCQEPIMNTGIDEPTGSVDSVTEEPVEPGLIRDYGAGIDPELLRQATYGDSDDDATDGEALAMAPDIVEHTPAGVGSSPEYPPLGEHPPEMPANVRQSPEKNLRVFSNENLGPEPLTGRASPQLREAVANLVLKCGRSHKEWYKRWRGSHEFLTAEDLRDGLANEAKTLVPMDDLKALLEAYGGPLTLSSFMRMVSDGKKPEERSTPDEAALVRIAKKIRGEKWAEVVFMSTSIEDIMVGLEREGIEVSEDDVRLLTSKLGRMGLVSALRARAK